MGPRAQRDSFDYQSAIFRAGTDKEGRESPCVKWTRHLLDSDLRVLMETWPKPMFHVQTYKLQLRISWQGMAKVISGVNTVVILLIIVQKLPSTSAQAPEQMVSGLP